MANTYTQIHIQAVFTVQNRDCIIAAVWKDELYKYITGIVHNNKHKVLAINGMPDHVHLLFGFRPTQSLSDFIQDVKGNSSKWINEKKFVKGRFSWQEGMVGFRMQNRIYRELFGTSETRKNIIRKRASSKSIVIC